MTSIMPFVRRRWVSGTRPGSARTTSYYALRFRQLLKKGRNGDHKRILELAPEALQNRKTQVEAEVEALRAEMGDIGRSTSTRKLEPSARPKGMRRAKTSAERKAQSKRMKAYWAAKKAAVAAEARKAADPALNPTSGMALLSTR
jgi:hypothetical protein